MKYRIVQTGPNKYVVQFKLLLWMSLFDTDYGPKEFESVESAEKRLRNYWLANWKYPKVVRTYG